MQFLQIREDALVLMRAMAGGHADCYVSEVLAPALKRAMQLPAEGLEDLRLGMADPYLCLKAIYGHYAFSRRGKERDGMSSMALKAFDRAAKASGFEAFLQKDDASSLWAEYVAVCGEHSKQPLEQLNLGLIAGLAELAQEIYAEDRTGSIPGWIVRAILQTGRIEQQFLRMVDVRGVGPKLTSLIFRDVVFLNGLEERLDPVDRLYVQPIDKWIRMIAPYIVDELEGDAADWVLAGKLAKYTRKGGISGIGFNMGVTAFGLRQSRAGETIEAGIERILRQPALS